MMQTENPPQRFELQIDRFAGVGGQNISRRKLLGTAMKTGLMSRFPRFTDEPAGRIRHCVCSYGCKVFRRSSTRERPALNR